MSSVIYIPKNIGPQVIFYPEYGLLYNHYAITDLRSIASEGWVVPSKTDCESLLLTLNSKFGCGTDGSSNSGGGYLKETGLTYWLSPNTGATNSVLFNARGAGARDFANGNYISLKSTLKMWNSNIVSSTMGNTATVDSNVNRFTTPTGIYNFSNNKKAGQSVRLIKLSTDLSDGQSGIYVGNDGKVYRTICIGTQEWLADNLAETKFTNGDIISWYGADYSNYYTNAEWIALTSAGCCAYNNEETIVGPGFSFPLNLGD